MNDRAETVPAEEPFSMADEFQRIKSEMQKVADYADERRKSIRQGARKAPNCFRV